MIPGHSGSRAASYKQLSQGRTPLAELYYYFSMSLLTNIIVVDYIIVAESSDLVTAVTYP
jgi:hypothetical protein